MLRHNLLLAFRNFKKFKSSFLINLIGLSAGLACTMLIYLWVNDELSMNKFHDNNHRLYQVMEHQKYAEEIITKATTPGILAESLAEEIPEVEYATTATWVNTNTLSVNNNNIKADGWYVGQDFFKVFSYGLVQGDPNQVLTDKNSIVISEELAIRLFKTKEDVIGNEVEYMHEETFLISGVFKGTPRHSSYQFDFVLSFERYKDDNAWVTSWGSNGPKTFILFREGSNIEAVNDKIFDFVTKKEQQTNITLFLRPYSDLYLYGRYENGVQSGGRIEYVQLFSAIAIFILIIACINFMNLSTARASRRTLEVGIKKALGASKESLIVQHLAESIVMTFGSFFMAIIIIWLFLPQFNEITGKQIMLEFETGIIFWYLGIVIFTGLFSGSYPALYLSGFRPVSVLKGEVIGSLGELWARRGLVIFQFTLSVILIVAVLVIFKQIQYVQNRNLGYDNDNVIYFSKEGTTIEKPEIFLNEIRKMPGIVSASTIGHNLVSSQNNTTGLDWEGKNREEEILFENVRVDYDLIEMLDIEILKGRSYSRDFSADTTKIIFNEAGIEVMGFQDEPIGQVIRLWDQYDLEIIGVAKNFNFQSLHNQVNPLFMRLDPRYTWNIMVRILAGREKETLQKLSSFYTSFNPGFVFDYYFLDEKFQENYATEQRVSTLSKYFAGIGILISCLGLFGLAAFTAERRLKEIGIRKVLGSSSARIVILLSGEFTKLVLLSILIAVPISYYLVHNWLQRFAYKIDLDAWFFIGSGMIALIIALITVGFQALKAANVNPSKCLRNE